LSSRRADAAADWLIAIGAAGLFASLFLTWSHQFSPQLLALPDARVGLRGVPSDPTAWQVYTIADALLAATAGALAIAALAGPRRYRLGLVPVIGLALAFAVHALSRAPTNGARLLNPGAAVPAYLPLMATAGVGETVAIASLGLAAAGIALSLITD
jgi:hypothetical protein